MSKVKSKKVKYVFSDYSQVIHLWANQSQEWAGTNKVSSSGWHHCPSERRVSFRGVRLYSYNTQIAEVGSYRGHKVALVSSEKYSNTTTQHQSSAMSAFDSAWIVLEAPELSFTKENIEAALIKKQEMLMSCLMSPFTSLVWYYDPHDEFKVMDFNLTVKRLGFAHLAIEPSEEFLSVRESQIDFLTEKTRERIENQIEKRKKDQEDRAAKAHADKLSFYGPEYQIFSELSEKDKFEAVKKHWIETGKSLFGENIHSITNAKFRSPNIVRVEGNTVYTSEGAQVPLSDAKLFLAALKKGAVKQGDSVGSFKFTSLTGDKLVIGCHTLSLKQCIEAVNGAVQKETRSVASNVVQLFGGSR